MRQWDEKEMPIKKILLISALLIGGISLNRLVLAVFKESFVLSLSFLLNIVVASMLTNTTYYAYRININKQYLTIASGSWLLVVNLILATAVTVGSLSEASQQVHFFFTIGKLLFLAGVFVPFVAKRSRLLEGRVIQRNVIAVTLLFVIESAFYIFSTKLMPFGSAFLYFLNVLYLLGLMILILELLLSEANQSEAVTPLLIYAFVVMFFSQFYMTVAPISYGALLNSAFVNFVALVVMTVELNETNIRVPKVHNNQLQKQFNIYSKYLKRIIDKKTLQVREVNQKIIDELEYAKIIQQSLLPSNRIKHRDVDFFSAYYPCERLSGDFYDIYSLDEDNVALYLLDVSGHGISAALMTMLSNNYLKSNERVIKRFRGMHPDKNLKYFYEQFNRMNFPDEVHMVIFYATLNLNTKVLTYCSGGMNCNPIRFRANGKVSFLDQSKGFPICRLEGLFTPEYTSETVQLQHGDKILFYTDGLTDKAKNQIFDTNEIIDLFVTNKHLTSKEINDLIVEKINARRGVLNDDITYIIMDV